MTAPQIGHEAGCSDCDRDLVSAIFFFFKGRKKINKFIVQCEHLISIQY